MPTPAQSRSASKPLVDCAKGGQKCRSAAWGTSDNDPEIGAKRCSLTTRATRPFLVQRANRLGREHQPDTAARRSDECVAQVTAPLNSEVVARPLAGRPTALGPSPLPQRVVPKHLLGSAGARYRFSPLSTWPASTTSCLASAARTCGCTVSSNPASATRTPAPRTTPPRSFGTRQEGVYRASRRTKNARSARWARRAKYGRPATAARTRQSLSSSVDPDVGQQPRGARSVHG
jgi:hypothetical protein